jgi:alcohol dehydrogenase class IV
MYLSIGKNMACVGFGIIHGFRHSLGVLEPIPHGVGVVLYIIQETDRKTRHRVFQFRKKYNHIKIKSVDEKIHILLFFSSLIYDLHMRVRLQLIHFLRTQ